MSDETNPSPSSEVPETPLETAGDGVTVAVEPLGITDKFIGILSEPTATYVNVRDAGSRSQ